MQNLTINGQQISMVFALAMPAVVAFLAGVLRQDRFPARINELISYIVIVLLAIVQTWLGGQFGGTIGNFLLVMAWAAIGLHTRYGQDFQAAIQTATSIGKLPPAPPQIPQINVNVAQLAALLLAEFQKQQQPIDMQPTSAMPVVVRESTSPVQQGG